MTKQQHWICPNEEFSKIYAMKDPEGGILPARAGGLIAFLLFLFVNLRAMVLILVSVKIINYSCNSHQSVVD